MVNSEVAQSCLTLCDPMDCSLPGSSVHGILQAIVLEWIAIPFSNPGLPHCRQTLYRLSHQGSHDEKAKTMTLKDEPHRSVDVQYATREIAPEGMKRLSQSGNGAQLWMCLVVKVKNSIA